MKVYVKEEPRSLALVSGNHVLVLRYFQDNGNGCRDNNYQEEKRPKCIVEFAEVDEIDLDSYRQLSIQECFGFLGFIYINNDAYLCAITKAAQVASPRVGENIFRIYNVEFYCLSKSDWDFITLDSNGYPIDLPTNGDSNANLEQKPGPSDQHPCANLRKLLSNGSFYYSTDFDLSSILQNRRSEAKKMTVDTIDESFMWNSYMMSELIKFRSRLPVDKRDALDDGGFLTTAIRGFAGTTRFRLGKNSAAALTIISRQSCKRAGTRFNARGVDDEGNVANFVETETILNVDDELWFGYTQVRGSVPTFWEQDTSILTSKINITRSLEASQPAFNRHYEALTQRFGTIHSVNLLAHNKPGEIELTQMFRDHVFSAQEGSLINNIALTEFDFHAEVARGGYDMASNIVPRLKHSLEEFGFYSRDLRNGRGLEEFEQIGVFRTNCLDCLDRTNMIQQVLSKNALELFFEYYNIDHVGLDVWHKHNFLWADNGDQLSQIYAGTNALKTSFTRSGKMNLAGAIADVTKSVGRIYINNFVDKGRQNVMDILLGRYEAQLQITLHDPINDFVTAELKRRQNEYSSTRDVSIFAGTFNLNGKMSDTDLSPWLFPFEHHSRQDDLPDLYLIGFQEIVELNAGQILNADTGKKEFWENQISICLNQRHEYVLLRSNQLVGTALFLFGKKSQVEDLKNVEASIKKTGLGGMAGNKGAVAVSFDYCDTKFCFITAHLASGMHNVDERHNDFKVLSRGLRFSRGKRIKDHDSVIWLGDFNYRIDMSNELARKLINIGDISSLFEKDQLNNQMEKGETFPYYNEMQITFLPTYKFDNGTDDYDTSEKARVPAWTDRIVSRGSNLKQTSYGSSPLRFSDHRPVYAMFLATILMIDQKVKTKLKDDLYEKRRAEVGDANYLVNLIDLNETTLTHGLPPPSSDTKKWWIDGGQAARVNLTPSLPSMVLNPNKSTPNPFSARNISEPDFVNRPPLPPRPNTEPKKIEETEETEETEEREEKEAKEKSANTNGVNSKGRKPPVVPKKPENLSPKMRFSTAPLVPSRNNSSVSVTTNVSSTSSNRPVPPPPRGSRSRVNSHGSSQSLPPDLPPRQGSRTSSISSGFSGISSNLSLMDDSVMSSSQMSWVPLQPVTNSRGSNVSNNLQ